eukprot:scaffold4034_cov142-Skeletonema_menzelii.AAC.5
MSAMGLGGGTHALGDMSGCINGDRATLTGTNTCFGRKCCVAGDVGVLGSSPRALPGCKGIQPDLNFKLKQMSSLECDLSGERWLVDNIKLGEYINKSEIALVGIWSTLYQ